MKYAGFLMLFGALALLTQCGHKSKQKIEGAWQLQKLEINGTVLNGKTLGMWQWTFDNDGSYYTRVGNTQDKGSYTLEQDTLKLKSVSYSQRPEQVLVVLQIDSLQMDLATANDGANKSTLHFTKGR